MPGTEICPFAQVGFGQDQRPGSAQALDQEGVLGGDPTLQGQRSGGGGQAIGGVDIVLEHNRQSVQRAAELTRLALGVELSGDGQSIGIDFDNRVQARPVLVDGGDAGEIDFYKTLAGQLTTSEFLDDFGNA